MTKNATATNITIYQRAKWLNIFLKLELQYISVLSV
jgi:hypothetical protein